MDERDVVRVEGLRVEYGPVRAVDDVSFACRRGEVLGLLGPNGAGKSTTVGCLLGLRRPSRGTVRVLGVDPWRAGAAHRRRVGAQLQEATLPDRLRVGEAVGLFAAFAGTAPDRGALLSEWGLRGLERRPFAALSGGQRQRLSIALALVADPELVVLDEVSAGLDPAARREAWDSVRRLRDRGVTVVLVSHLMEEVEALCDRVVVVVAGRTVADDTPARLAAAGRRGRAVRFTPPSALPAGLLSDLPEVTSVEADGGELVVHGTGALLLAVAAALAAAGLDAPDLRPHTPSLEDAYLALVGDAAEVRA